MVCYRKVHLAMKKPILAFLLLASCHEERPALITCADWVRYQQSWYDSQRVLYEICRDEVQAGRLPCAVIEYGKCKIQVMPDREVVG